MMLLHNIHMCADPATTGVHDPSNRIAAMQLSLSCFATHYCYVSLVVTLTKPPAMGVMIYLVGRLTGTGQLIVSAPKGILFCGKYHDACCSLGMPFTHGMCLIVWETAVLDSM